jgi:ParB family chromosome partitioning protein
MGWNRSSTEKASKTKRRRRAKKQDGPELEQERITRGIPQTLEEIPVDEVRTVGKRRELDPDNVAKLAASISMVSMRTPIVVTRVESERQGVSNTVFNLLAGAHRLAAVKSLGLDRIQAFVIEGNKVDAKILRLMDNLYRMDLTALQHAEDLAELVRTVQSEQGGQVAHPGGAQPHDKGISRAAKLLGFDRKEVRRALQIDGISAEAKAKATEFGLDKKQSKLLQVAKENGPEAQLAKINELAEAKSPHGGEKKVEPHSDETVDDAEQDDPSPSIVPETDDEESDQQESDGPHAPDDEKEEEDPQYAALKTAWRKASRQVRKRFVKEVLQLDLDQIDDTIWTAA